MTSPVIIEPKSSPTTPTPQEPPTADFALVAKSVARRLSDDPAQWLDRHRQAGGE